MVILLPTCEDDDVLSTPPIIQPTSPPILAPTGGISTNDNTCIICPNGATAGDDLAQYSDFGDPTTCAEIIDSAKLFENGPKDCGWAEMYKLDCCPTEPENPCIICPNGGYWEV